MNNIFYWSLTILQVLSLIVAYVIQMFSTKKMGMMRHLIYTNQKWEMQYPIQTMRNISIGFLVILSIIILYRLIRKHNYTTNKKALYMILMEVIITIIFVSFTLFYSSESYLSYYFISIALGIILLLQGIKSIAYLKKANLK